MSERDEPDWVGARHLNIEQDELLPSVYEIQRSWTGLSWETCERLQGYIAEILAKAKQHYEQNLLIVKGNEHPEERLPLYKPEQKRLDRPELREALAELEHEQWITWSKSIAKSEHLDYDRLEGWMKLWIPYAELTEEQKDQDRIWADKSLALIPDMEEAKKPLLEEIKHLEGIIESLSNR